MPAQDLRTEGVIDRLQRLLAAGAWERVLRATGPLMDVASVAPQAALMHGVALVNLGRVDAAAAFVARLGPGQVPAPAALAYLQAVIAIAQGDRAQARMHLETALVEDGQYALMALHHPGLSPLLDEIEPR